MGQLVVAVISTWFWVVVVVLEIHTPRNCTLQLVMEDEYEGEAVVSPFLVMVVVK